MSLPSFSTQGELFSTAGLSASLLAETDRYRLFAKLVSSEYKVVYIQDQITALPWFCQ